MNYNIHNGFIDLNSVSYRLKNRRESLGYSLEYVSNELLKQNIKLGISAIWKYENNQIRQLNVSTIAALSNIYCVPQKYILYGDYSMEINTLGEISDKKLAIINLIMNINDLDYLRNIEQNIIKAYQDSGVDPNNYE
ncbi:hypothetical protein [uncultured Sneathia sp.]|uniref:helix-turn-helix domain-containing protein n=1 Tax=uncultured Sneathia sp. TaxID=278067 RepID=UPI00259756E2|nr:hypothetical protein [uncultured Sneathia sp.]